MEALSATGLRSIRYAKEIPLVRLACHSHHALCSYYYVRSQRYVIANDLSPTATAAMIRNVELNDLGAGGDGNGPDTAEMGRQGKVRVNQGDAR